MSRISYSDTRHDEERRRALDTDLAKSFGTGTVDAVAHEVVKNIPADTPRFKRVLAKALSAVSLEMAMSQSDDYQALHQRASGLDTPLALFLGFKLTDDDEVRATYKLCPVSATPMVKAEGVTVFSLEPREEHTTLKFNTLAEVANWIERQEAAQR